MSFIWIIFFMNWTKNWNMDLNLILKNACTVTQYWWHCLQRVYSRDFDAQNDRSITWYEEMHVFFLFSHMHIYYIYRFICMYTIDHSACIRYVFTFALFHSFVRMNRICRILYNSHSDSQRDDSINMTELVVKSTIWEKPLPFGADGGELSKAGRRRSGQAVYRAI